MGRMDPGGLRSRAREGEGEGEFTIRRWFSIFVTPWKATTFGWRMQARMRTSVKTSSWSAGRIIWAKDFFNATWAPAK